MPRAIQLGRYHLLDRIAFGGMAEIYRAQTYDAIGLVQIVAIKRVLRHLAEDDDFLNMLVDEARIASMLESENIAKVYEFGHVGRDYFIAMEYVGGKDVRSIMERCRAESRWVPPEICAFVIKETMQGLHAAHELRDGDGKHLNLIHRDVSPSNIICAYGGEVKLCDFGIAKATLSRVKTRAGVIKGKVKYMSPEQALGRKLDRRSDIFSAGSVLYEMLTRVPPFLAPNEMELILKVRDAKYVPVRERNPTIPPALELIVDKAMSRSRSSRYVTAQEFADDLQSFLNNHAKGFRSAHLARFLKSLFRKDIEEEEEKLKEYEVIEADESNLGENLIADSMGPAAPWSRFSPVPTSSHQLPKPQTPRDNDSPQSLVDMESFEPPPNERSVSGFIHFESKDPEKRAAELQNMAQTVQLGELEALIEGNEQHFEINEINERHDGEAEEEEPLEEPAEELGPEIHGGFTKGKQAPNSQFEEDVSPDLDLEHEDEAIHKSFGDSSNAHASENEPSEPDKAEYENGTEYEFDESDSIRMPVDHDADTSLLELSSALRREIAASKENRYNDPNTAALDNEENIDENHDENSSLAHSHNDESLHDRPTQILQLENDEFSVNEEGLAFCRLDHANHYDSAMPDEREMSASRGRENKSEPSRAEFGPCRPTPTTQEDEVFFENSPSEANVNERETPPPPPESALPLPPPPPPPPPLNTSPSSFVGQNEHIEEKTEDKSNGHQDGERHQGRSVLGNPAKSAFGPARPTPTTMEEDVVDLDPDDIEKEPDSEQAPSPNPSTAQPEGKERESTSGVEERNRSEFNKQASSPFSSVAPGPQGSYSRRRHFSTFQGFPTPTHPDKWTLVSPMESTEEDQPDDPLPPPPPPPPPPPEDEE